MKVVVGRTSFVKFGCLVHCMDSLEKLFGEMQASAEIGKSLRETISKRGLESPNRITLDKICR